MTKSENQLKVDKACVVRFVAFSVLMGFVNLIPYLLTREASSHGIGEVAGWPFHCCRDGRLVDTDGFYPWALMGDIIVAVILTGLATWIFREGIWKTLWKWKTSGTPYAE